jgi:F-box/leucine-rich repeat protein 17
LPHPDLDCPKETEQVRLNYFSHTVSEKIIKECAIDQLVVSGDNSLSIQAMLFLNPRLLSLASVKKEHFSSLMNKFSDLKKVTFASTSWLTDELLVNFVKKNPHLTHIEIHEMKDDLLTENGIREMASYCHRLTSLIFLTYPLRKSRLTLSDNTMKSIVDNCKELEIIDIGSRGRKISDCNACIQKVAESPMKFEELYFNGMTTSSDSAMTALAAKQPSLKKLHLSANYEITDVSLKALADHCPDLEYISLSDCRKITKGGIDYLQSKLPQLKIKR